MKYKIDYKVISNTSPTDGYSLLVLKPTEGQLPMMEGGQFVNVEAPDGAVFLRRPISVNRADYDKDHLWLLIKSIGKGTRSICDVKEGEKLSIVGPLGKGFSLPQCDQNQEVLLIGGGVGIAPLLYWGEILKRSGRKVHFLLGGRSKKDLMELDLFEQIGALSVSTEDGSLGEKGLVTQNRALESSDYGMIYCCGPMPMMKAVAAIAREKKIPCEVSLENKMACGIGACLCCVEDTTDGNRCVCSDGPVFNIDELKW